MSYLADAHRDWHTVYGPVGTVICPLDCYDPPYDGPEMGGAIKCGSCKYNHPTVDDVRLCYGQS